MLSRVLHCLAWSRKGIPWKKRETWRRRQVMKGRTGALDLPGKTWQDRPAIDRGDGVFLAGADKGVAYALLNEYLRRQPQRCMADAVPFARVTTRQQLIATVLDWLRAGRKPVIKPQGTGLGHGIEFFLTRDESEDSVVARIDGSLRFTETHYRMPGGALPYTICEYLDTCAIDRPGHALFGHKYELRVVIYRDGDWLKAFPSIVKVASEAYDSSRPSHLSLINNITTSAQAKQIAGAKFMLPLANRATLDLIGLSVAELEELCSAATSFMRFVVDRVQDEP